MNFFKFKKTEKQLIEILNKRLNVDIEDLFEFDKNKIKEFYETVKDEKRIGNDKTKFFKEYLTMMGFNIMIPVKESERMNPDATEFLLEIIESSEALENFKEAIFCFGTITSEIFLRHSEFLIPSYEFSIKKYFPDVYNDDRVKVVVSLSDENSYINEKLNLRWEEIIRNTGGTEYEDLKTFPFDWVRKEKLTGTEISYILSSPEFNPLDNWIKLADFKNDPYLLKVLFANDSLINRCNGDDDLCNFFANLFDAILEVFENYINVSPIPNSKNEEEKLNWKSKFIRYSSLKNMFIIYEIKTRRGDISFVEKHCERISNLYRTACLFFEEVQRKFIEYKESESFIPGKIPIGNLLGKLNFPVCCVNISRIISHMEGIGSII